MLLFAVIITVVVIVIYVIFSSRNILKGYFKYFKSDLKYRKDVKESLKIDLKTRILTNETINEGIDFLNENLPEYKNITEFIISDYIKRKLIYSKFSERSIKELFALITKHLGITEHGVDLEVKNISSRNQRGYTGIYFEGNEVSDKKITILINSDYTYETVLSILIHESTHYFLLSNGIKLKDRELNEYLTDIASVYLGFGKIMLEGYKQKKKLIYIGEIKRTTSSYKVGYLNYSDVKYIMKIIKKKSINY